MKTAISIPDRTFREAERMAKQLKLSRSALYARAVESLLKRFREEDVTARLDAYYATDAGAVDPVLHELQLRTLRRTPW